MLELIDNDLAVSSIIVDIHASSPLYCPYDAGMRNYTFYELGMSSSAGGPSHIFIARNDTNNFDIWYVDLDHQPDGSPRTEHAQPCRYMLALMYVQ